MDTLDIQAVESKLSDVTVTAVPLTSNKLQTNCNNQIHTSTSNNGTNTVNINQNATSTGSASPQAGLSKYGQLLMVIEEMSREVRPTYAGSRSSAERLRRNIISAKSLVKECLIEAEKSSRQ